MPPRSAQAAAIISENPPSPVLPVAPAGPVAPVAIPFGAGLGQQSYANVVQYGAATRDGQANAGNYVTPVKLSPADENTVQTLRLQWDQLLNGRVQAAVNSKSELEAVARLNVAEARAHHNAMAVQHGSGGIKWKDLVQTIRKHETAVTDAFKAFQTAIANAMKGICNRPPVSCRALGRTELTSDFDVMIEGPDMQANLNAELTIEWMLTKTFLRDSFFWANPDAPSFDLKRVLEFFDINFYLNNFGLMRAGNTADDRLASYYLSTAFADSSRLPLWRTSLLRRKRSKFSTARPRPSYRSRSRCSLLARRPRSSR